MGAFWGGDIHREHPGKIFTPCEPSRECILPEGGPWGPLGPWANPRRVLFLQRTMAPLLGGGEYSREKALQRVGPPPMAPLTLGVLLGVFASKFANNLEWIACKLITLHLYSSM